MILNFLDRLKKWSDNFKIEDYKYDEYQCEISDFFKYSISKVKYENSKNPDFKLKINNFEGSEQFILFWRKKFSQEYFELQHPIHNNIKTKAICNFPADINNRRFGNYILFVDEDNKYPWIVLQVYEFFQLLITQEGIYHSPLSSSWEKNDINVYTLRDLNSSITYCLENKNIKYSNTKFGWNLDKCRPGHYFMEDLASLYALNISKNMVCDKSFYMPPKLITSIDLKQVGIYPNIFSHTFLHDILKEKMALRVFDENIPNGNLENTKDELKIWVSVGSEHRAWLNQIDGYTNIILELGRHFSKIEVFFDAITSYENIKIDEKQIKIDSQNIYNIIDKVKNKADFQFIPFVMTGKNYKDKIAYCSKVDICIAQAGTAEFVPVSFCNKDGVVYWGGPENFHSTCACGNKKALFVNLVGNENFVHRPNAKNWYSGSYFISWQFIFNKLIDVVNKIKKTQIKYLHISNIQDVQELYYLAIENNKLKEQIVKLNDNMQKTKLQQEYNESKSTLDSYDAKEQLLRISNLEQDLANKKLNAKETNQNILIKELEIKKLEQDLNINRVFSYIPKEQSAKDRIHNHLSYKLGQAMIENSKSLLGYIRMSFVLSYIKDKHKQEQQQYQEAIKKNPNLKLPNLESYPDYKEALKEKECLTYKLGESLIKANKTWYKGGYVKLWFEIRRIKLEFKNKKEKK
ncbi:hypothetical protein ACKAZK_000945 [Campylobacter coli]